MNKTMYNFARASCFFSSDMEIPNFMHLLYGFSEHSTKISFFFPHSGAVLSDSAPENFANI